MAASEVWGKVCWTLTGYSLKNQTFLKTWFCILKIFSYILHTFQPLGRYKENTESALGLVCFKTLMAHRLLLSRPGSARRAVCPSPHPRPERALPHLVAWEPSLGLAVRPQLRCRLCRLLLEAPPPQFPTGKTGQGRTVTRHPGCREDAHCPKSSSTSTPHVVGTRLLIPTQHLLPPSPFFPGEPDFSQHVSPALSLGLPERPVLSLCPANLETE